MPDEQAQIIPDVTVGVETEQAPPSTRKKTTRAKKASSDKTAATATQQVKPKTRGLDSQEKLELIQKIEAQVADGKTLKDAVQSVGISDQTYYVWKKAVAQPLEAAPTPQVPSGDELAEFTELEEENRRLRKLLSEKLRAENAELRKRLGMG